RAVIARSWRPDVLVQALQEKMGAAGSSVSNREKAIGGKLLFDIEIELLHHALLEVQVLRLHSASEVADRLRRGLYRESSRDGTGGKVRCLRIRWERRRP